MLLNYLEEIKERPQFYPSYISFDSVFNFGCTTYWIGFTFYRLAMNLITWSRSVSHIFARAITAFCMVIIE